MQLTRNFLILLFIGFTSLNACKDSTTANTEENKTAGSKAKIESLSPDAFEKMLLGVADYHLIDVRTPQEFAEKHLSGAVNIDFNAPTFEKNIQALDNSKPVFVYCLSGGRSSGAADMLEKQGFKEIYNLEGGMMGWTAANKSFENIDSTPKSSISMEEYEKLVASDKIVLVDFNAVWCGPCKKLKPVVEQLEKEGLVKLVSIDVDENEAIAQHFKIESIPLLKLYKNGKEVWSKLGYEDKMKEAEIAEIREAIKSK